MRRKSLAFARSLYPSWRLERNLGKVERQLSRLGLDLLVDIRPTLEPVSGYPITEPASWCFVVQGPLGTEPELEYFEFSLRLLRQIYPNVAVFLAAYDLHRSSKLEALCTLFNVDFAYIEDPGPVQLPSPVNLCRQITGVSTGLSMAKQCGFEFAFRMRCDQSIRSRLAIPSAEFLLDQFPVSSESPAHRRIFGSSLGSYVHRPLGLTDMMMFGHIDDLARYWAPETPTTLQSKTMQWSKEFQHDLWQGFSIPETWLAFRYLLSLDVSLADPYEANWEFWHAYAGVFDSNLVRQSWRKAPSWAVANYTSRKWLEEENPPVNQEMHFWDWLSLYRSDQSNQNDSSLRLI